MIIIFLAIFLLFGFLIYLDAMAIKKENDGLIIALKSVSKQIIENSKLDAELECGRKEMMVAAKTYGRIIDHLLKSVNDPRKRERIRVQIALRTIKGWFQEEKDKEFGGNANEK